MPKKHDDIEKLVSHIQHHGCECGGLRGKPPLGVTVAHVRNHLQQLLKEAA